MLTTIKNICFIKESNIHTMHLAIRPIVKAFEQMQESLVEAIPQVELNFLRHSLLEIVRNRLRIFSKKFSEIKSSHQRHVDILVSSLI